MSVFTGLVQYARGVFLWCLKFRKGYFEILPIHCKRQKAAVLSALRKGIGVARLGHTAVCSDVAVHGFHTACAVACTAKRRIEQFGKCRVRQQRFGRFYL